MKNLINNRKFRTAAMTAMTVFAPAMAFADTQKDMYSVVQPIVDLLNTFLGPLLLIVGAVGALYCVLLGVKYARAEEPQDREKAKAHLKNAIIGFALIFVLMLALKLLMPALTTWVQQNGVTNG